MDKYKILETKLTTVSAYINDMKLENEVSKKHLKQYKLYLDKLIVATKEKTIRNSDGAVLGLIKGISDYDEICSDEIFWNLVTDVDNYYSNECKRF